MVWGFWAILVIAPLLQQTVEPALARLTNGTGPFSRPPTGFDVFSASVVLAIMILPTIAVSRSAIEAVSRGQREAALALGATRSETARLAVLRPARSGIVAAILLGFGRAAGEAIIVVSLIGNVYTAPMSLFAQGRTIAGEVLNDLNSGSGAERGALVELTLVLLVLTLVVNVAARLLLHSIRARSAGSPSGRSNRAKRLARWGVASGPGYARAALLPAVAAATRPNLRPPPRRRALRRIGTVSALVLTAAATAIALLPIASVAWTAGSEGGSAVVRPSLLHERAPRSCPVVERIDLSDRRDWPGHPGHDPPAWSCLLGGGAPRAARGDLPL